MNIATIRNGRDAVNTVSEGIADWEEIKAIARKRAARGANRMWFASLAEAEAVQATTTSDRVRLMAKEAINDIWRAGLRRKAREAGVSTSLWWIFDGLKISTEAVRIATSVLARVHGERTAANKGGWDSWNDRGIGCYKLEQMWYAAGCRDCGKFRTQVATGYVAKKGESEMEFRHYARGMRWLERNRMAWKGTTHLSRKAVAALGRLSAPLRWAAVHGVDVWGKDVTVREIHMPNCEWPCSVTVPVRVVDLNWERVAKVQDALRGGSAVVRAAALPARGVFATLGLEIPEADKGAIQHQATALLCPQYAKDGVIKLELAQAQAIVLGLATPRDVVGGGHLTGKEVHRFLMDHNGSANPADWLAAQLGLPVTHRSVKVVRWLGVVRAKGWWQHLETERQHFVGGEQHTFRYLDLLDEIQDADIVTGKEGVAVVFGRASERNGEEFYLKYKDDYKTLSHDVPRWAAGKLPRGMRLLNTPADLAREGRDLMHCVGTYVESVRNGSSIIIAVVTRQGRSTIELTREGSIRQHRGVKNAEVPKRNEQLVTAWMNRKRDHDHAVLSRAA